MDRLLRPLPPHFNLTRWFSVASLLVITVIATVSALVMNGLISERMLRQEARLTGEYVHSLLEVEKSMVAFFSEPSRGIDSETSIALQHIAALPDVLRANVYDRQGRVVWSSDAEMIGREFGLNRELDRALAGEVVFKKEDGDHHPTKGKQEHQGLRHDESMFIEIYVPVTDPSRKHIAAVMELYKNPQALAATLRDMRWWVAGGALGGGTLLLAALLSLVRRADQTIRSQQKQLVDGETLAAMGEMSSVVAHGLRNPLASIRSSAELLREDASFAHEAAGDIVAQADRLDAWVTQLLSYARPLDGPMGPVALAPLVAQCLDDFGHELQRRRIEGRIEIPQDLPAVAGEAMMLGQVVRSLIANAIEALGREGRIVIRGEPEPSRAGVMLSVVDSGPGMTPAQLERVGKPFHTTKTRGLGVGLALARRVVERFGGGLDVESSVGAGTVVRLHLRSA